ncbi:MAG TPA: hypothetical protein VJU87_10800 [Gemmatimonadaceae bacterium]|nr:hypothetical protein [Gemmatimonadaceae bacterium]
MTLEERELWARHRVVDLTRQLVTAPSLVLADSIVFSALRREIADLGTIELAIARAPKRGGDQTATRDRHEQPEAEVLQQVGPSRKVPKKRKGSMVAQERARVGA